MLVIITLSGIFLTQKIRLYQYNLDQATTQNIERARLIVQHNLNSVKLLYQEQLQHIIKDEPVITHAFQQRDRQRLYENTLDIYQHLKNSQPEFQNMHFHLPDGRSFLRMHKPSEHGDSLIALRPMISAIHNDQTVKEGYEIGVHGLYYRFIQPVFYDDQYVGALEIGIKPEVIVQDLEEILNVKIGLFVLNEADVLHTHADIEGIHEHYMMTNDTDGLFNEYLKNNPHFHQSQQIKSGSGHTLFYRVAQMQDFRGNTVGQLVIAQNIEQQLNDLKKFITSSCLITLGLTFAAYLILRLTFNPMIQKIVTLNENLENKVRERTRDLYESKKRTEQKNAELYQILNTAGGAMRILDKDFKTLKVNQTFENLSGLNAEDMIGKPCYEVFNGHLCHTSGCTLKRILKGEERIEADIVKTRHDGTTVPCILTATALRSPDGELMGIIEDFRDTTILKQYLAKEKINVDLAQRILGLINPHNDQSIKINNRISIFSKVIFSSSKAAGGDHFFIQQFAPEQSHTEGRTVLSLKDQSGHEVNCLLKSIATDLIHNVILHSSECKSLDCEISKLNREILESGLFNDDDFITAITAEIDHATMTLKYISCGHPPFLLIREGMVSSYPVHRCRDRQLPLGVSAEIRYASSQLKLLKGDQLIFFTDGLLDMPIEKTGKVLSIEDLQVLTGEILELNGPLSVSELIHEIFHEIARRSEEKALPFQKNTSKDDVTLFGIELEDQTADVTKELHINSHDSFTWHLGQLLEEIHEQAEEHRFVLDTKRLRMIMEEALLNAWKHGHGCSNKLPITVSWRFRNELTIEIIDQGSGFNINLVPDPTNRENILNESGRGLFLIQQFSDKAVWKDQGRHLQISFKRIDSMDRRKGRRKQQINKLNIWNNTKAEK